MFRIKSSHKKLSDPFSLAGCVGGGLDIHQAVFFDQLFCECFFSNFSHLIFSVVV
tara:strand:+ start:509 stop:673 length:165 start_codon:yes stop_codon:yes gene_type:complete